jgi:hypothetical protein
MARRRQARAEIATDRARRHCRYSHHFAPSGWQQPIVFI